MNETDTDTPLTPAQIENWRKLLCVQFGPYALIMPDKEVQAHRDRIQRALSTDFTRPSVYDKK